MTEEDNCAWIVEGPCPTIQAALAVLVEVAEDYLGEYGFSQGEAENERQLSAIRAGCAVLGRRSCFDEDERPE